MINTIKQFMNKLTRYCSMSNEAGKMEKKKEIKKPVEKKPNG